MNLSIGTKVWIHAMGSYYAGTIVKHGAGEIVTHEPKTGKVVASKPNRVLVEYTSGAGKTRQKWQKYFLGAKAYASHEHEASCFPLCDGGLPKPAGSRQVGV